MAFSKFTSGLHKPFDDRLKDAMVKVSQDLIEKFTPAVMAYHHSDEISLVFLAAEAKEDDRFTDEGERTLCDSESLHEHQASSQLLPDANESVLADVSTHSKKKKVKHSHPRPLPAHIYSGRVQKLASVTASFASARLNYYLSLYDWADLSQQVVDKIKGFNAYFDGRVVPLPNMVAAMECVYWRSNFDGFRNSVNCIAQAMYSHKELQGLSVVKVLERLHNAGGVDVFEKYGCKYLFGTWLKKEQYEVFGFINPKTGQPVETPVLRKRVRTGSFNWAEYSEQERLKFVASKYWPDGDRYPKDDLLS